MNSDNKNKDLCKGCTLCCEHVTIEINNPETKEDYEEIIWMLMHEHVTVYIDDDGWNVEFKTKCNALTKDNFCLIYKERPTICRNYNQEECLRYGGDEFCNHLFQTKEDLMKYLKEKNIILDK